MDRDESVTDTAAVNCVPDMQQATNSPDDVTDSHESEVELLDKYGTSEGTVTFSKQKKGTLHKGLNLLDAIAFIVSGTIGSGIFITPASILEKTGSFGVSMICWFAGMLIAMCGGLCYTELGLLIQRTGAEYVYILEAYSFRNRNKWTKLLGSLLAFLYTWTSILIIRPTSTSIIVLTCTRYLTRPFYVDCDIPETLLKTLTISIIIFQAMINCWGVKLMAKINTVITVVKLLSIIFIVIIGISGVIQRGHVSDDFRHPFRGTSITSASDVGNLAVALYAVLFAYDGWNSFGFAIEEMKNPERNLPRSMAIGLVIVSVCYYLVNLSFFSILSNDQIVGTPAVALPFGKAVLGKAGLVVIPLLVAISTFGTAILNIYVSSRLIFSSAREGQFPEVFCGVHATWHTPVAAIILQTCATSLYVLAGDISSLIEGFSAALWVFFFLSFSSILIMRFTHRDEKRPFKVWWIVPVIMILVSVFLVVLPLTRGPGWSVAAFGVILSGAPVYFLVVMETPWRIRPHFLDTWSEIVSKHVNRILQAKSAR